MLGSFKEVFDLQFILFHCQICKWNITALLLISQLFSIMIILVKASRGAKLMQFLAWLGYNHGKVDQLSAPVYQNHHFLGERPKSSSKALFKLDFFSWQSLLMCWALKCRKSSWDLQYLSLNVMLKSKWLSHALDIDFMTITILKLEFSFI